MSGNVLKSVNEIWKVAFTTKGFAPFFRNVVITSADNKKITGEFTVTEEMTNIAGNLHGGATATLADMFSSVGLLCIEGNNKSGVSVNLSVDYIRGAKMGEEIIIESETVKLGRTLAFLDIVLKKKANGDLIAKCSHVKHLGS